jgi:hypothetical protein
MNSLNKAIIISENMDSTLLLISDALYLSKYIEKKHFKKIYVLKEDYKKRFKNNDMFELLDYNELIDLIMKKDNSIVNL